jgi:hypothetical protein
LNLRATWSLDRGQIIKSNLRVPRCRGGLAFLREEALDAAGQEVADLGEAF